MITEPYNYELITQHPKLLALYSGWLGQKICFLTHLGVTWDRSDYWSAAAAEIDRLVLVMRCAEKAKVLNLSDEAGAALGKLVGCFAAGGWWTSKDGARERAACQQARREKDEFTGDEPGPGDAPFQPHLLLECDSVYSAAPTVINQLDGVLMQTAVAMDNLDLCRLGVSLSGFCYRSTSQLGLPFIESVLDNLAARGVTDLQAENEFRRAVGLSEVTKDRLPRSLTDPAPVPPLVLEDITAAHNSQYSFPRYRTDMTDHCDLVLGCVFNRFDIAVPPAENDALQYPELPRLKKKLQASSVKATKSSGKTNLAEQTKFWSEEAIEYLGLNRLGLARPDMALQRLIKKGVLRPTKIGGRLMFKKVELDRVLEKGDQAPRRGRPRKDGK
ncbi:MAG: helix-turn-helix domain-containing protein [Phycisphaerae bacterium]|nr:helix-turn-helix domain-containing protein [Phycisphaerae bacterium]